MIVEHNGKTYKVNYGYGGWANVKVRIRNHYAWRRINTTGPVARAVLAKAREADGYGQFLMTSLAYEVDLLRRCEEAGTYSGPYLDNVAEKVEARLDLLTTGRAA